MKLVLAVFISCINLGVVAQQIAVKGTVSILNSGQENDGKITFVDNVYITSLLAKPDFSDEVGKFKLEFAGEDLGTEISLTAQKSGYDVVNVLALESLVLGGVKDVQIFLIEEGGLEKAKLKLYQISEDALFAERDSIIGELRADNERSQIAIKQLEEKFGKEIKDKEEAEELLLAEIKYLRKQLPKFALILAKQNLDFASELYKNAYNLFLKGDIRALIELLSEKTVMEIIDAVNSSYKKKKALEADVTALGFTYKGQLREAIQICELKANAYLLNFDYVKGIENYQIIIQLLEDKEETNQKEFAFFLEKTAKLLEEYSNQLKSDWQLNYEQIEALQVQMMAYQSKALTIYESNPDRFAVDIIGAYVSLGDMLENVSGDTDSSFYYYGLARELIFEEEAVAEKNAIAAIKIARAYSDIAFMKYRIREAYVEIANGLYDRAIEIQNNVNSNSLALAEIYQQRALEFWNDKEDRVEILEQSHATLLATLQNDDPRLAESYIYLAESFNFKEEQKIFDYLLSAIDIYNTIKSKNENDFFYSDRIKAYEALGTQCASMGRYEDAERYLRQAVEEKELNPLSSFNRFARFDRLIDFYCEQEKFELALEYQQQYLKEENELGAGAVYHVPLLEGLLNIYHKMGDHNKEIEVLDEIIIMSSGQGLLGDVLYFDYKRLRAEAFINIGDYNKAILELNEVASYLRVDELNEGTELELSVVYERLSKAYEFLEDYDLAVKYFEIYMEQRELLDNYFNNELKLDKKKLKALKKKLK